MRKILVVDDEVSICSLVKFALEKEGHYKVIISSEGKNALLSAEREKPDLILLDIAMPGMDGLEVLKRLKDNARTVEIPVVMFTARSDEASKETAARLYDEEYITKPFEMEDLKTRIEEVLHRRGR